MSGGILTKKVWRLKDIIHKEGAAEVVNILKINHRFRQQRIILVPTPRYAAESFYTDWVYQPYVKEHFLYVSNDLYNPFYLFYNRGRITRGGYPGYAYFHPMGFPDCIDLNLTRRAFLKREQPFRTPVSLMLCTTNHFRDRYHPWVSRRVNKIVGEQYVVHPREDVQSMVFILPAAYCPDVVNTLQSLGFEVSETVSASIGAEETLGKLNRSSSLCQLTVLLYLWALMVLFVVGESSRMVKLFNEYKRDLILKAGKDPDKMGL